MFSGGGVMAAVFLPILVLLFALAFPLEWVSRPDHEHLLAVVSHPLTRLFLLGMFVVLLVHSAHRFRYTLYDGLQIKQKRDPRGALLRECLRRARSPRSSSSWAWPDPRSGGPAWSCPPRVLATPDGRALEVGWRSDAAVTLP